MLDTEEVGSGSSSLIQVNNLPGILVLSGWIGSVGGACPFGDFNVLVGEFGREHENETMKTRVFVGM